MKDNPWNPRGGTGDDAISVWRAVVEAINSLRKVAQTIANQNASNGTISMSSASTAATFEVALPPVAELIEGTISISPATDGANLWSRFGAGGTIFNGAGDYSWANLRAATSTNSTGDTQMIMGTNFEINTASHFNFSLYRPGVSGRKFLLWEGVIVENAASTPVVTISGGGRFLDNTNPIDTLQFLFSTGNIFSVQCTLHSIGLSA